MFETEYILTYKEKEEGLFGEEQTVRTQTFDDKDDAENAYALEASDKKHTQLKLYERIK